MMKVMEVDEEENLPDDVALLCLQRVPRPHHGLLRCVCRRWRRLPTFFDLRASQNLSREWLCVLLRTSSSAYKWFVFVDNMWLWLPLPAIPHHTIGAACAVAAGKLYMIGGGGSQDERAGRRVWAFNPGNNQWEAAASMKIAREFAAAGVIDGQIYVLGGCLPGSSIDGAESWAEKYDPLTNQWSDIPSPPVNMYKWMHGNVVLHDKLFAVADGGGIIFNPLNSSWDCISDNLCSGWTGRAAVVNNILFSCNDLGQLFGYDLETDVWLQVQGLERRLPESVSCAMLSSVGGKLYMLWEMRRSGWKTKFLLTALNILKQPGMLRGEVIWYRVFACNGLVGTPIHSLSLAL